MTQELYEHQRSGIEFLFDCLHKGTRQSPKGVLLADGLGLGKTRQVIGTMMKLKAKRSLIVVPASVLHHWEKELEAMKYEHSIFILHNSSTRSLPQTLPEKYVVVTTYKTFEIQQLYKKLWDFLALDEATQCKNSETTISKLVKKLRKTPYKIAVSGTPSQNCLNEFHSLFEFLNPQLLGPRDVFEREFSLPVKQGARRGASKESRTKAAQVLQILQKIVKPYVLRRTMEKPCSKTEVVVWSEMTPVEKLIYDQLKRENADEQSLRSVLNGQNLSMLRTGELSGKQQALVHMVSHFLNEGHSIAIFVNRLDFMKWIKDFIQNRHDIVVGCISGSVASDDRQALIDAFNAKAIRVLVLTARSSATGINLTTCARTILTNADWNSSVDDQAAARSHRMTSKVDSQVYRMITRSSIEENIYETQLRKTTTNNELLRGVTRSTSQDENRPCIQNDSSFLVALGLETESHDKIVARAALHEQEFQRFQDRYQKERTLHKTQKSQRLAKEKRDKSIGKLLLKQLFEKNKNKLDMKTVLEFYKTLVDKKKLCITREAYRNNVQNLSVYKESVGKWILRSKHR